MVEGPEYSGCDSGKRSLDVRDVEVSNVFLAHALRGSRVDEGLKKTRTHMHLSTITKILLNSSEASHSSFVARRSCNGRKHVDEEFCEVPVKVL